MRVAYIVLIKGTNKTEEITRTSSRSIEENVMLNSTVFNTTMLSFNDNATRSAGFITKSYESCINDLRALGDDKLFGKNEVFCNGTWDEVYCWHAASANKTMYLPCPPFHSFDPAKNVFRRCGSDGKWDGPDDGWWRWKCNNNNFPNGYTNFTMCYTEAGLKEYKKYFDGKCPEEQQMLKDIASGVRTMEIVGLSLSLVVSLISLFIFAFFRTLRCSRTRIHRNLLVSIVAQTLMRLLIYIDQIVAKAISGETGGAVGLGSGTIFDTAIVCEAVYTLIEYTKTVVFMWMLVEGIHLHNIVAVSVFSGKPNFKIFYIIGWGGPIPITLAWVISMTFRIQTKCWFPYYNLGEYWIMEGPRLVVITVNLVFLLNIIRILVAKLKEQGNDRNITKVRKAVKAAIVLLPLLGITNFVDMTEAPTEVIPYAVWAYTTYFLDCFQGFFVALLYCFMNGEVQMAIRKHVGQVRQLRMVHSSFIRSGSRSSSALQRRQSNPHHSNEKADPLLKETTLQDSQL